MRKIYWFVTENVALSKGVIVFFSSPIVSVEMYERHYLRSLSRQNLYLSDMLFERVDP